MALPTVAKALPNAARRPALIYFGAYRNMDQLVQPNAKWDFVRQNMDGFVMHFGFWLNNDFKGDPIGVGKKLSAQLNPLGKKWMMEVGWPGAGMDDHFADMGQWYGERHARQIQQFRRDTNIKVDEISCDFRLFGLRRIAEHFPDFDAKDVYQELTGDAPGYPKAGRAKATYWPDYVRQMNKELPDTKIHITYPPLYSSWDTFSGAGKNFDFTVPRSLPGQTAPTDVRMKYNGRDFLASLFKENAYGFIADSPYSIMTNPNYAKQGYMDKVLTMQNWLHSRGKQFSYIVNGKPDAKLAPAVWDAQYKDVSLKSLQLFQSVGGRADRYLFESWHIGPHRIVPETQDGTYTNLVLDAIKYLKGTGQKLDLAVKKPAGTAPQVYEVVLTNRGEVTCMPTIGAKENGVPAGLLRYSVAGQDVTADAHSPEGHVFTAMLAPGASTTLTVTLSPTATVPTKKWTTTLQAAWNPQDDGQVRDTVTISGPSQN